MARKKITQQDVLSALHPTIWRYGLEIFYLILDAKQIQPKTTWDHLFMTPSLGALYVILHQLETEGEVEGKWGEPHEIRRGYRRRYYRITTSGYRRRVELEARSEAAGLINKPSTA